jgi:predicted transcriptional regulator
MIISFKEYIESKNILRNAAEDSAKIKISYIVNKYCKIPITEDIEDTDKKYIQFKPKDTIEIFWEKHEDKMIARFLVVNEEYKVYPTWTIKKFNNWVDSTCSNL